MMIKSHPFLGRRLFVCLFVVATLRGIMGGCMHVPGEALGQISDCHLHNTASSEGRKSKFATVNLISPIIPNNPLSFQLKIKVESLDCQICFKSVPSIK